MAETSNSPFWDDAGKVRASLMAKGWLSPDTYISKLFAPLPNTSGVYLFMVYNPEDFSRAFVAYVGMATNLANRLKSHDVLPKIRVHGFQPLIWFKLISREHLRSSERSYIRHFDPPWNLIGRQRGVRT